MLEYLSSEIVRDLVNAGVEPVITKSGLKIDGFYKSGTVLLTVNSSGEFVVKARYDEYTFVHTFDDLVHLNYDWWQRSKDRSDEWKQPCEPWASEMVRLGLVKKTVVTDVFYE